MSRLPNVNALAAMIQDRVASVDAAHMSKVAAENAPPDYVIPVAQNLVKLAQALRAVDVDAVTYGDLREFSAMIGH